MHVLIETWSVVIVVAPLTAAAICAASRRARVAEYANLAYVASGCPQQLGFERETAGMIDTGTNRNPFRAIS
jgi:hypothetical protein